VVLQRRETWGRLEMAPDILAALRKMSTWANFQQFPEF
jgi:hypothetical protein